MTRVVTNRAAAVRERGREFVGPVVTQDQAHVPEKQRPIGEERSRYTVSERIRLGDYPTGPALTKKWISLAPAEPGDGIRVKYKGGVSEPISALTLTKGGMGKNVGLGYDTTAIDVGGTRIEYVEHIVAALVGAGITDAVIEFEQKRTPSLGSTSQLVFEKVVNKIKKLAGQAKPLMLNPTALSERGLDAVDARRELEERGVPKELFWPGDNQKVIMLAPADNRLRDRIFLKETTGPSVVSAFTHYPNFEAIPRQWYSMECTEAGFRGVMDARGTAFSPPIATGFLLWLGGKRFGPLQFHSITPKNRLIVKKGAREFLNPPGTEARPGEVSKHRILDFMLNIPEGLSGVSLLLYMCGHETDIEMMGKALRERILV